MTSRAGAPAVSRAGPIAFYDLVSLGNHTFEDHSDSSG